jgi:cytochrome c553
MRVLNLKLALPAAILAIVFLGFGLADDTGNAHGLRGYRAYRASRHPPPGQVARSDREARAGTLQAKIQYCSDCHGASGRGYRGYYPIPRLAGQTAEYFETQLRAFVERRREAHIAMPMSKMHGLSPGLQTVLAAHFSELNPAPIGGAPKRLRDTGKDIYEGGIPDDNVPACQVCHGPEARGTRGIPRLAGQLYPYTVKELVNWDRERGQGGGADTSAVMRPIAHSLTKSQIEAVAAYLSDLE